VQELSLFTGAGGGVLASRLLGWITKGYVECDDYCQRTIASRIRDGVIHDAPIFGDIRAFIHEGYADSYQGMVDVVTAGFPCQPFSVANPRIDHAKNNPRNLWPETIEVIRRVRPRYCLLENVPGLRSLRHNYFSSILGDLAESGRDAKWRLLSAQEVGAPHPRSRLWIKADVADCDGPRCEERRRASAVSQEHNPFECSSQISWWDEDPADREAESGLGRVVDGMAYRVDRLRALGNGQVPAVAATAWNLLTGG